VIGIIPVTNQEALLSHSLACQGKVQHDDLSNINYVNILPVTGIDKKDEVCFSGSKR